VRLIAFGHFFIPGKVMNYLVVDHKFLLSKDYLEIEDIEHLDYEFFG
jgi:hypothetical protein